MISHVGGHLPRLELPRLGPPLGVLRPTAGLASGLCSRGLAAVFALRAASPAAFALAAALGAALLPAVKLHFLARVQG